MMRDYRFWLGLIVLILALVFIKPLIDPYIAPPRPKIER